MTDSRVRFIPKGYVEIPIISPTAPPDKSCLGYLVIDENEAKYLANVAYQNHEGRLSSGITLGGTIDVESKTFKSVYFQPLPGVKYVGKLEGEKND